MNWLRMWAGPAYFELVTGDARFSEMTRYLDGSEAAVIQSNLWQAYQAGASGLGTGISAFPSMHLSMAMLFVLAARRIHRALGWVFTVYMIWLLASSVFLGWHYAIDGIFSIAATGGIWWAVGAWRNARRPVLAREPDVGRAPVRP
jgi:uncharacterized membrane protein